MDTISRRVIMNKRSSADRLSNRRNRYRAALADIPVPGIGKGCHTKLLGVATLGIKAGCSDEGIRADIRTHIPPGARKVPDREIREAIERAHKDTRPQDGYTPFRRPIPPPRRTEAQMIAELLKDRAVFTAFRAEVLEAGGGELDPFGADVWEASPIRIEARSEAFPYSGDMLPLLEHLYAPDDLLFIGRKEDSGTGHIRPAAEWCEFFRAKIEEAERCGSDDRKAELGARLGEQYPLIAPNPLTGNAAPTKAGDKLTLRGDACVKEFRYFVAECDELSLPQQGALLRGLCRKRYFRIAAMIYSGGKSCHAWLKCDGVKSSEEWEREVKQERFALLTALGFDGACANPSRMSRLPGVFRNDKGRWQQLLYLAPEGGEL